MVTSRQLRLLRGSAAASVATILAAVSHTLGGGAAPHPMLIAALSVFLTPIAAILIGSRLNLARLSATVLVSQAVFHVLFIVLNATTASTGAGSNGGHQHVLVLTPIGEAAEGSAPGAMMFSAHLIAGILTIALLWRGERALRAIARWADTIFQRSVQRAHDEWPVPASVTGTPHAYTPTIVISDVTPRGPPVLSRG